MTLCSACGWERSVGFVARVTAVLAWVSPLAAQWRPSREPNPPTAPQQDAPPGSSLDEYRPPERWRAAFEMSLGLIGGTVWYWIDDRNVLDWDRPSLEQRLNGEAWRFDNNGAAINFLFHPLAGGGFYAVGRANHLGVAEAFLYGLGASSLWEYVIEFKERVSINDMIVTPVAGMPIGEFGHKLARYVNDVPARNVSEKVTQWSLGPFVRIHQAVDGYDPPANAPRDALGFSESIWHEFNATYHVGRVIHDSGASWTAQEVGFDGLLVSLPGFRRPVTLERWFWGAEVSRLAFDFAHQRGELDGELFSETLLAGWYNQRWAQPRRGTAWTVATSLGYHYRHSHAFGFDDRQGIVHFPGAAIDLFVRNGGLHLDASVRAHADFAGVSTVSYPSWRMLNEDDRVKTIVERERYFYGWGGSAALWGTLGLDPLWARGEVRFGRYQSQQGLDRNQEAVTHDVELSETIREYDVTLGLRPMPLLGLGLRRRVRHRLSRTEQTSTNQMAEELGLMLEVAF